jgi:SAM-dependent methyltransferase
MRLSRKINYVFARLDIDGFPWLVSAIYYRLKPARPALAHQILTAATEATGMEIGGPSRVFGRRGILPVYPRLAFLDNVNFAGNTAWEAGLREGGDFVFHPGKPSGRQFLREATALTSIPDDTYDLVLSSHCLEHVANPLRALREWRRIVRPGGSLVLILPDPAHTFDHLRPITTLEHLRSDFERSTPESDLTHLKEILIRHDLGRDLHAGRPSDFCERAESNPENRCLHHHVFDLALMRAALEETGWIVDGCENVRPIHLVALAHKRS